MQQADDRLEHPPAVVREHGQPVGIISDTDIFQIVEERGWGPEQE